MKKALSIILAAAVLLTILAGCGGGKTSSESPAPAQSGDTSAGNEENDENKYCGIGEAAEATDLSITIDGAEPFDYTDMITSPKEGFEYVKVWFTFKNVSDETIESPDRKDMYIVYEEGPTGDDSDMTSEENSQVMLGVADRDKRYMSGVDLAPGESTGGWMVYQRQTNKDEITMHYYSGFVNVAPDLRFRFTLDASAKGTPAAQIPTPKATEQPENEQVVDYTSFSIDEITGTYNLAAAGTENYYQIELFTAEDMLVLRFANGTENEYEYDLVFGAATRYVEFDDGHTILTILTFTRDGYTIRLAVDESLTYADGSTKTGSYEGYRVD